jgi:hypothetical protein
MAVTEVVWDGGGDQKLVRDEEQVINDLSGGGSMLQWPACLISWLHGCGAMLWRSTQGQLGSGGSVQLR